MKKYAFIFFITSQIFASNTPYSVALDEIHLSTISYDNALKAEVFFTQHEYSKFDTTEFTINMKKIARVIISFLIHSNRETAESLMKKFNEDRIALLSASPIVEFCEGSLCFPSMPVHLKDYYRRHGNVSLVNPPPVSKPESHTICEEEQPWYSDFISFFSSTKKKSPSESSQGTTSSKRSDAYADNNSDTNPLIKKNQ